MIVQSSSVPPHKIGHQYCKWASSRERWSGTEIATAHPNMKYTQCGRELCRNYTADSCLLIKLGFSSKGELMLNIDLWVFLPKVWALPGFNCRAAQPWALFSQCASVLKKKPQIGDSQKTSQSRRSQMNRHLLVHLACKRFWNECMVFAAST